MVENVIPFLFFIVPCLIACAFDIACRIHGGADTPTEPDALLALMASGARRRLARGL